MGGSYTDLHGLTDHVRQACRTLGVIPVSGEAGRVTFRCPFCKRRREMSNTALLRLAKTTGAMTRCEAGTPGKRCAGRRGGRRKVVAVVATVPPPATPPA